MKSTSLRVVLVVASVAMLVVALAACGDDDSTGSGSTPESDTASKEGKQEASAFVAPYIGKPSPFPVTEELKEVPKDITIAYMDCGTQVCALFWQLIQPAASTLGIKLDRIKAGTAANTVSAAFDTVVAKKPDGVLVMATPIALWSKQLGELKQANVPVVVEGVAAAEAKRYGVPAGNAGTAEANELAGKLLANYVTAKLAPSADAHVVVYEIPEVGVTQEVGDSVVSTLESICPECSVRTANVSAATLGNKAPSVVVSDLQAHPDTDVAVFTSDEIQLGLPAALEAAGIEVKTLGYGPSPANLQYIKDGKETAALAADFPVTAWTTLDQLVREVIGQEPAGLEAKGIGVLQFLTSKDITFDPSKGWTGYPDFAQRFAKLWGVEG